MNTYTLGFLFKNKKIILAKKKRKIGVDKWNGYGGRVEENEDKIESLAREIEEECGAIIEKEKCKELGFVDFYFKGKDELNQRVYIYRIDGFSGEPKETEEMGKPEEFDFNKIPYNEMMKGDENFIPFVLANKKFKGEIHFSENGEKLINCIFIEIANEGDREIKLR